MKIVVAALSAPAQLNGVSRHGANLVRSLLTSNKVEAVHFLCGDWQREMFSESIPAGDRRLHTHYIPLGDANVHRLLWYFRELPEIAAQLDASIVHLTFPSPIGDRGFPCPTVVTLHDLYPFDVPENFGLLRSTLARQIVSRCLRRVNSIACASSSTRTRLAKWFPVELGKATVIPNMVDLPSSNSCGKGVDGLSGRYFALCVAQHRSNKNVPLAIRIFKRAIDEKALPQEARLAVVGISGPGTKSILAEIKRLNLSHRVVLLNGLTEPELRWCYDHCMLMLAPSTIEGFGLPLVEASLAGCRIVCSDIPAFREVGDSGCHLVAWEGDLLSSYTCAIREAMAEPKPLPRVLQQFTPGVIGQQYLSLYEKLIYSPSIESDMLRQPESMAKAVSRIESPPNAV